MQAPAALPVNLIIPSKLGHNCPCARRKINGVDVQLHSFLTSAIDRASGLGRFTHQERRPRYPLHGRLDGPQSRSGRFRDKNNVWCRLKKLHYVGYSKQTQPVLTFCFLWLICKPHLALDTQTEELVGHSPRIRLLVSNTI